MQILLSGIQIPRSQIQTHILTTSRNIFSSTSEDDLAKKRTYRILSNEEVIAGKKTQWNALEITGTIRNLSPGLFNLHFLTSLYLNDNHLSRVPPEICKLTNLLTLDLSCNKLRSLPIELGDLVTLR